MAVYNPNEYNGNEEDGNATVIPVHAYISSDAQEIIDEDGNPTGQFGGYIPFTVNFYAWSIPGAVPAGNQSSGASVIFSIDDIPTAVSNQLSGSLPTWTWSYRFTEQSPNPHNIIITALGGSQIDQDSLEIWSHPSLPSGSAKLVIRALKIAALPKIYTQFETTGDQI